MLRCEWRIWYIYCDLMECNNDDNIIYIMQVSVPRSSLCTVVTVRCGHCTAILSVNMMMRTTLVPFQLLASLDHHQVINYFIITPLYFTHSWSYSNLCAWSNVSSRTDAKLKQSSKQGEEEEEGDSINPKPWEKNSPSLEEEDNNDDSPVTQTAVTKRIHHLILLVFTDILTSNLIEHEFKNMHFNCLSYILAAPEKRQRAPSAYNCFIK